MNDKGLELAKKLKALSERGIEGEAINAQATLRRVMEKYGITDEDLEKQEKQWRVFKYRPGQKQLFFQIASSVLGRNLSFRRRTYTREIHFEVTDVQYAELMVKVELYGKAFKQGLGDYTLAFIYKNGIFPSDDRPDEAPALTQEEIDQIKRAVPLMDGIKPTDINPDRKKLS